MSKRREKKDKPKPMAGGVRIQQMCPAQPDWRVLLLELDDDGNPVLTDDGAPDHNLVDIACWALLLDEDDAHRYQEMLPCVPTNEGTLEPVDPEEPGFIAILSPSDSLDDVDKMVEDYVLAMSEGDDGDEADDG